MTDDHADIALDPETRLAHDDHDALRLWLRMLTCTMLVERHIRARLKGRFGMSLPRFDLMAQLERAKDGLRMSELSRRLMVSGGNVTSLVDQLVRDGLVERRDVPGDRRAFAVCLTPRGREAFLAMAREHEAWIVELTGGLARSDRDRLHQLLGRFKRSLPAP
ncbi:MAG: MarR family transcriptional regulator [Betaproteobacteria bacterium]|jgi:DNA-binding MarR family transcriptional regulator|nr:MarR family transcriptional regulator [Betaproteobacteria bacterium]